MNAEESEQMEKLLEENQKLKDVLQGIINSCVHPDKAVRAVFVDLKPIKKVLNK